MRIAGFDVPDLVGGLLVFLCGCAVAVGSTAYPMGQLTHMGPGYVPLVAGIVLAVLGLGLIVSSRAVQSSLPDIRLRPVLAVFASLLFWALTIERLGLVPSTLGLVVIASLAQDKPSPTRIMMTAIILVGFSLVLFVYGLRMPIDVIGY